MKELMRTLLIMSIILIFKFIDWRERCEEGDCHDLI
jgi:hypothetical protein